MEVLLIVALLASNIYLIGKVLKKPAEKHPPAPATNSEETPSPASSEPDDDSLVGRSHYDMDRLNSLIDAKVNSRVDEKVDEIVTRIRTELTSPEDVGLPPEEPAQPEQEKTIPQERLDEVFTHHTVGESFGDAPEITERQTGGQDFKALESAVRVAKDEPHTPEEAAAAKETLKEIQGTVIEEQLSLDPKVRTRILSIIYGDEDEPLTKEVIAKKKVVYSKTIDTVDIDRINLNILT